MASSFRPARHYMPLYSRVTAALHRHVPAGMPGALAFIIASLPIQASARNLDCTVRYECSGGSCREVSRSYSTHAGAQKITVQSQGYEVDLVMLDKTSGGDLVYGGQVGPNLYGVFFLEPSNGATLMLQGVNGWSEAKTEMLICTEAAS